MVRIVLLLSLIGILLPSLLIGCDKSENTDTEYGVSAKTAIPLIDTYTPSEVETATFALG